MTRQRHYHPLAALRFLRKAVVVCLLPLANALLEFSLNALLTALRQDAALLLFLCGASSACREMPAAGVFFKKRSETVSQKPGGSGYIGCKAKSPPPLRPCFSGKTTQRRKHHAAAFYHGYRK